jgi:hypothetical protein
MKPLGWIVFCALWIAGLAAADHLAAAGYLHTVWVMGFGAVWIGFCGSAGERVSRWLK